MTNCIVYRRFSTDEQEFGSSDTLARQFNHCEAMAAQRGWTITGVMTDKGRSAFKGHHLLPDAELGQFMTQLRQGDIPAGTILMAYDVTRLSRRPIDEAQALIYEINKAGVTIALASDGLIYDANPDLGEFIKRAVDMGIAHKSSADKSKMTTDSKTALWVLAQKREGKWTSFAAKTPSWLTPNKTRDGWVEDASRIEVVNRIYEMAADLSLGATAIAQRLNVAGTKPFAKPTKYHSTGGTWGNSSVRQILLSPAVEGDWIGSTGPYGGQKIVGFYPRIVDADLVARARAAVTSRRKVVGERKGSTSVNLFAGVSMCGHCRRRAFSYSTRQKGRDYAYVRCEAAGERRCPNKGGFSYAAFEKTALDLLIDLALDDRFFESGDELRAARIRVAELEKSIRDATAGRARLMEAFANDQTDDQAMTMIATRKVEIDRAKAELGLALKAAAKAGGQVDGVEHLRRVNDIRDAAKSSDWTIRNHARTKLRQALEAIVMSVDIDRDDEGQKVFTVILKGGVMGFRIDTTGQLLSTVSDALGKPLWSYLSPDNQKQFAPLIERIEKLGG